MTSELTIAAVLSPGLDLLTRITQVVHAAGVPLETLIWTVMPHTNEARIWMTLPEGEPRLHELIAALGQLPGVQRVSVGGPGGLLIEAFHVSPLTP